MTTGNSFTKFMLIVCGIVLITAALSGCVDDADASDTIFTEQRIQKILDDDTPINDVHDMINTVAKQNNYDVDVVRNKKTDEIISIGVDDNKGNNARFSNTDKNPDVDTVTLNGKEIYPTSGEAESPQTQLANEPSGASNELYKELLSQDDPEAFKQLLGMDINDLAIKGLGTPDDESRLDAVKEGRRTTLEWETGYNDKLEPKTGLTIYKEYYNKGFNGLMFASGDNYFEIGDDKNNDGEIDIVLGRINGQEFKYEL